MTDAVGRSNDRRPVVRNGYFFVPNMPPRFSGSAKPGGGVAGNWAGGLGVGGFGAAVVIV
jgi:hypothetical protein